MRPYGTRNYGVGRLAGALMCAALVLLACGPAATPSAGGGEEASARTAPKTLVMGFRSSLVPLVAFGRPNSSSTGPNEMWLSYHANLSMFDIQGTPIPQLAQKVPSIEEGDWKVNPDGTMEVTWKIKPNAVWHDGTPLTAQDYAFSFEFIKDPKVPFTSPGEVANMTGVRALDPQTLVISWKTLSVWGNHNGVWGLPALPRHLIEDLYRSGDTPSIENSPIWGAQWVGLGPFRVLSVDPEIQLEAEAFDHYVLGRPKIDRLIFKIIPALETLQTNVLAGAVDVVTPGASFKPEHISEFQRRWDEGEAFTIPIHWRTLWINYNDPAAPWAQDPRFRQAMLMYLPRAELVESHQYGLSEVANYWAAADDPLIRLAEQRGIPKYPYDPTRADQLFAQAGWTKGADGLLRNSAGQATGPFLCCRNAAESDAADVRESLIVVDSLKKAGIQAEHPFPATPAGVSGAAARKFSALAWQGRIAPGRFTEALWFRTWVTAEAPHDGSGWTGGNLGAWTNPAYDALHDQMNRSLEIGPRQELRLQLMKLINDELPAIPMWYEALGVTHKKTVTGLAKSPHAPPLLKMSTWNIHTWDIRS